MKGSDLTFVSQRSGVAWRDVLPASSATRGVAWRLDPSRGLDAVLVSGGVAFRTRAGRTVWVFTAPAARLADGQLVAVRLSLRHVRGGVLLIEKPRLQAKSTGVSIGRGASGGGLRPMSVTISGVVYPGYLGNATSITGDCTIASANPTTSYCDQSTDYVGPNDSILLNFNIGANVPDHSQILDAWIATKQVSESNDSAEQVGVWQAAEPWTSAATWNTYDGTHSWTTAGGDVAGSDEDVNNYGSSGDVGTYSYWSVVTSTQAWTDHNPSQVDGFILKPTNPTGVTDVEGFAGQASSTPPYMQVYYEPRVGDDPGDAYDSQPITDRSSVGVNEASGDLQYTAQDVNLAGINGLGLSLTRTYNNLESHDQDSVGMGWSLGTGPDTYLVMPADNENEVDYFDGTGSAQEYQTNPAGNWVIPSGSDANISMSDSTAAASTSFTLSFRHSGRTETFTTSATSLPKYARLSTVSDRNGNTIHYYYNGSGQLTSIVDSYGNTTTFTWTSGYITEIVDPTGRTYQYAQNSSGQLTSYIDPAGNTTYYTYDSYGNLTKITTAAGNITKVAYDTGASERVTSITRLVHPTDGSGPTTSFSYAGPESPCPSNAGWKTMIATDPNSHATTYCTDDLGMIQNVYDANGHSEAATYTADGFIGTGTSGLGAVTTYTYGSGGTDNVTNVQDGTGSGALSDTMAYTDSSNPYLPTSVTDPQGNTISYTYDPHGKLLTETDGLSSQNESTFTYNSNGTIATATNPEGSVTTYGYTSGNLTSVTAPSGSGLNPVTLTYDSANRVVKVSTVAGSPATGHEVDYTYDKFDRVTQEVYKNAAGSTVATLTFTYDADGNLTQRVDPQGTTTYTYDGLNRLTGETFPNGSTDSYGYDPASNLTTLTDAGGTTTYGYDSANQLTSVTDPGASTATSLSYDADGNLTHVNYPSGALITRTYNSLDQLTNVSDQYNTGGGTYALTYAYTYDGSLIHTATDVASNVTTYTYDALNRLTEAKVMNGGTQIRDNAYTLDGVGNIVRSTVNGTTTSYAYNPANEICWSYAGYSTNSCSSPPSGASSYSYDTDGNQTSNGAGTTMTYNALGQMTSETVSGTATTFAYDGDNQNELITDGSTSLHNDILGVGSTTTSSGTTYYTRTIDGTKIDERTPSGTYNYLYDGEGNVVGLTNSAGQLVKQYAYDPYGNVTYSPGSVTSSFEFQDGYQTSTGLYHFGARFLNPTQASWTQQDPQAGSLAQNPTQADAYVFAGSDPTNETDPSGEGSVGPGTVGQAEQIIAKDNAYCAAHRYGNIPQTGVSCNPGNLVALARLVETVTQLVFEGAAIYNGALECAETLDIGCTVAISFEAGLDKLGRQYIWRDSYLP